MKRGLVRSLGRKGYLNFLPDRIYLPLIYKSEIGKKLHLKSPRDINEKLQWIKLYDRKEIYHKYVDKYAVREIVAERIGEDALIPLVGVYDTVEEIDWESLPDSFVMKCTHASGANIICSDKKTLNIEECKEKLHTWMNYDWFWMGREWPYVGVPHRIICEKNMSVGGKAPDDIKIWCFGGTPELINIHRDRFGDHRQDFYNTDGKLLKINNVGYINSDIKEIEIDDALSRCLNYAKELSKDTYLSRIDFYIVEGKPYFGEITFFDGAGFSRFVPEEVNYLLGDAIILPTDGEKEYKGIDWTGYLD